MTDQPGEPLGDPGALGELEEERPADARPSLDAPTIDEFYEQASCGYLSLTADGVIVRTNETFARWTGRSREELLGELRFQTLLTVGSRLYFETHCAPMLSAGMELREVALDLRRSDGSILLMLLGATVHQSSAGQAAITRVTIFDASGRRGFERHLLAERDAERLARQHAEALSRISGRLAVLDTAAQIGAAIAGELVGGGVATRAELVPRTAAAPRMTATFRTAPGSSVTVGVVPVVGGGGEAFGVLRLDCPEPPSDERRAFLESAAELVGRALGRVQRNAAMARATRSGAAAGLPNERWWAAALKAELRRADQAGTPLTIVIVEITRLDRITLSQGMEAADELLLSVSDAWRAAGFDLLSRFGGEEFVVLMPGLDLSAAKASVAHAKRVAGASHHFSVGIAQWDRSESPQALASRAELQLSQAR
ncbi:MAG: sensor domain-containing diguanylate cyclase [Solirubrobacteraceae bacterium]|nr:sensor domain-containing diguanylate cyclase [Solirubrobacteraceae bacterium]